MIQNIIFDMGQVLIRWSPEEIMAAFDLSAEQRDQLRTELFRGVEWIQHDRGTLNSEQVTERVCARLPEALHEVVRTIVFGWHRNYLVPMPGMAELAGELKEAGYHLYLLSNACDALRGYFPRIPGSGCFEKLMVSAEEKLLKPQHEIYERLFEKFELDPAECLFIDDAPANIEGALAAGMRGLVFYGDVTRLRRELHQAGIRCNLE